MAIRSPNKPSDYYARAATYSLLCWRLSTVQEKKDSHWRAYEWQMKRHFQFLKAEKINES